MRLVLERTFAWFVPAHLLTGCMVFQKRWFAHFAVRATFGISRGIMSILADDEFGAWMAGSLLLSRAMREHRSSLSIVVV